MICIIFGRLSSCSAANPSRGRDRARVVSFSLLLALIFLDDLVFPAKLSFGS